LHGTTLYVNAYALLRLLIAQPRTVLYNSDLQGVTNQVVVLLPSSAKFLSVQTMIFPIHRL